MAAGVAGVGAVVVPSGASASAPSAAVQRTGALETEVTLRWLGNNGWEISAGEATILIDPWLTRFKTGTYKPSGASPSTPIIVDPSRIDRHVSTATHILVTHGHYDHLPDVPHIARKTGATVFGTETHLNLMRALGAPPDQLSLVNGGENFQFEGFTIEVFRSNHSTQEGKLLFPGTRPGVVPPKPRTIGDLVEGDTLAYLITIGDVKILNFGSSNFAAREIEGVRPDVLLVQPGGAGTPQYVPRMFEALGSPRYVIPTHWDDFDEPLTAPAVDWGGLEALREAVALASPSSEFVVVDHLERFVVR